LIQKEKRDYTQLEVSTNQQSSLNINIYFDFNNFLSRRKDQGMLNSVLRKYEITNQTAQKLVKDNFLDFICERMFAYTQYERHLVERALEDHIDKTGLGCFFLSKAIDNFISKIQYFWRFSGLIRHFTESFNYGFTQSFDIDSVYLIFNKHVGNFDDSDSFEEEEFAEDPFQLDFGNFDNQQSGIFFLRNRIHLEDHSKELDKLVKMYKAYLNLKLKHFLKN
jgi:hypothetical protein